MSRKVTSFTVRTHNASAYEIQIEADRFSREKDGTYFYANDERVGFVEKPISIVPVFTESQAKTDTVAAFKEGEDVLYRAHVGKHLPAVVEKCMGYMLGSHYYFIAIEDGPRMRVREGRLSPVTAPTRQPKYRAGQAVMWHNGKETEKCIVKSSRTTDRGWVYFLETTEGLLISKVSERKLIPAPRYPVLAKVAYNCGGTMMPFIVDASYWISPHGYCYSIHSEYPLNEDSSDIVRIVNVREGDLTEAATTPPLPVQTEEPVVETKGSDVGSDREVHPDFWTTKPFYKVGASVMWHDLRCRVLDVRYFSISGFMYTITGDSVSKVVPQNSLTPASIYVVGESVCLRESNDIAIRASGVTEDDVQGYKKFRITKVEKGIDGRWWYSLDCNLYVPEDRLTNGPKFSMGQIVTYLEGIYCVSTVVRSQEEERSPHVYSYAIKSLADGATVSTSEEELAAIPEPVIEEGSLVMHRGEVGTTDPGVSMVREVKDFQGQKMCRIADDDRHWVALDAVVLCPKFEAGDRVLCYGEERVVNRLLLEPGYCAAFYVMNDSVLAVPEFALKAL